MSFKRTKVVMLPTEKSSDIILRTRDNVIHQRKYYGTAWEDMGDVYQHLYFLSDDEIKEGDWYVNFKVNEKNWDEIIPDRVCKADLNKTNEFKVHPYSKYCKKIIATTDKNLIWLDKSEKNPELARPNGLWKCLPEPSEGFIQKFVNAYNSGNPITEVDVEYERVKQALSIISKKTKNGSDYTEVEWEFQDILKINPKDNTITIKKIKDTWTRDEVVNLLQQFNNDKSGVFDCTKWIEENL